MKKDFGFIERDSFFVHAHDIIDRQSSIFGFKVSFTHDFDEKTGKAKDVAIEECAKPVTSNEMPREMGKRWNAEKGFGFIGRENGEADVSFHKRAFDGYSEPDTGQSLSSSKKDSRVQLLLISKRKRVG